MAPAGEPSPVPLLHFPAGARYTAEPRPDDDDAATEQTIGRMIEYTTADSRSPILRRAAYAAIGTARTEREKLTRIFAWVKSRLTFVEDAELVSGLSGTAADDEVLVRPVDILTMPRPAGDCDDFSMLTAAMLRAVGIPSEFVTVAADAHAPEMYSHVYVRALTAEGPIALDTSHGPFIGWQCQPKGKIRRWPMQRATLKAIDWGSIINTGITQGAAVARVAVAQPGTYIADQRGTLYTAPAGQAGGAVAMPGLISGGFDFNTLAIGGITLAAVAVIVMAFSRKGNR